MHYCSLLAIEWYRHYMYWGSDVHTFPHTYNGLIAAFQVIPLLIIVRMILDSAPHMLI
jgi:thiamine transporter ThiT